METTRGERAKLFAGIHALARNKAGKSQEYMALELGISKKTVQNWESGVSSPSFFQSLEWFKVLNVNPFRDYLSVIYPHIFKDLTGTSEDEQVDAAFQELMAQLPMSDKRALLYLFYGEHGSSAHSLLQLFIAYLHTPLNTRLALANMAVNLYELESSMDKLICKDNIMPDLDDLKESIRKATIAVMNNESGYDVTMKNVKD